uniref:Amino acid transporter transmembrane domain-containing protein n=1 Tax=Parascaris univalens TaxID=6257 RepID=A0A915BDS4_PARUN
MADGPIERDMNYSSAIGFLFVFNLIVGTGALALPKAFQTAGYVLSITITFLSSIISYICATFVVESMAVANAAKLHVRCRRGEPISSSTDDNNPYSIKQRIEVSEMARIFLGRTGLMASYAILTVYLFGDLSIYSTTVPKSIMNIICSAVNASSQAWDQECHSGWPLMLNRINVYRLIVVLFALFVTPLVLVGVTRTKYLQFSTSLCRWLAFILMIFLASLSLIQDGAEGSPAIADFNGFGSLFGTTVYAFMCQHSLPAIITPMTNKRHIFIGLFAVYIVVLFFYIALSLTGAFAFQHVFDIYTLNFLHDQTSASLFYSILNHFLTLFPVFTLTTNYPIVANTLNNNLTILSEIINSNVITRTDEEGRLLEDYDAEEGPANVTSNEAHRDQTTNHEWRRRVILASVIAFPTLTALVTDDVLMLASLTGSYPGVGVQFVIPSLLVVYARRYSIRELGTAVPASASSPFSGMIWPWAMFTWATFTTLMVTLNFCHRSY